MDCPECKLINPPGAERCDCGYDFKTGTMQESYLTERDYKRLSKAEIAAAILAKYLLVQVAVGFMYGAREEEHFRAPLLLAVVVLAGVLGFWIWRENASSQK